jgi:hypothetical protein
MEDGRGRGRWRGGWEASPCNQSPTAAPRQPHRPLPCRTSSVMVNGIMNMGNRGRLRDARAMTWGGRGTWSPARVKGGVPGAQHNPTQKPPGMAMHTSRGFLKEEKGAMPWGEGRWSEVRGGGGAGWTKGNCHRGPRSQAAEFGKEGGRANARVYTYLSPAPWSREWAPHPAQVTARPTQMQGHRRHERGCTRGGGRDSQQHLAQTVPDGKTQVTTISPPHTATRRRRRTHSP